MRGITSGLIVLASLLVACQSTPEGQQQSEKLNSSVTRLRESLSLADSNLRLVIDAHKALLSAEGDLKGPYQEFAGSLKSAKKSLSDLQSRLVDANAAATTYFQTYEDNLDTITDEGVREQSRARLETRRNAFGEVRTKLQAGADAYSPILEKLDAHATALGLELTPASIEGIKADSGDLTDAAESWLKSEDEMAKSITEFLKKNASSVPASQ